MAGFIYRVVKTIVRVEAKRESARVVRAGVAAVKTPAKATYEFARAAVTKAPRSNPVSAERVIHESTIYASTRAGMQTRVILDSVTRAVYRTAVYRQIQLSKYVARTVARDAMLPYHAAVSTYRAVRGTRVIQAALGKAPNRFDRSLDAANVALTRVGLQTTGRQTVTSAIRVGTYSYAEE